MDSATNRNDTKQQGPRWTEVRIFSDDKSGLAVRVMKLDLRHPRYEWQMGRTTQDGFRPNVHPTTIVENFVVRLIPASIETVARLIAQAERLIYEEMQHHEDETQAWAARRESRSIQGDRHSTVGKGLSRFTAKATAAETSK